MDKEPIPDTQKLIDDAKKLNSIANNKTILDKLNKNTKDMIKKMVTTQKLPMCHYYD